MGYKGQSVMDCGYFFIDRITGGWRYVPPPGTVLGDDGRLHLKEPPCKEPERTPFLQKLIDILMGN
jgi:hypothetical protein